MRSRILGLGRLVTIAALVGCGSGGGGGTFTTSVPAGTKLTSLTSAQATQLCTDLGSYEQKGLSTDLCKFIGIEAALAVEALSSQQPTNADLQTACTQAYDGCLSPDGGTSSSSCGPSTFTAEPSTCTATVGDLQACASDETTQYNQVFGALPSCSALTTANLTSALASVSGDGGSGPPPPASCAKLTAQGCTIGSMGSGNTSTN
jgi:hypothetical protein